MRLVSPSPSVTFLFELHAYTHGKRLFRDPLTLELPAALLLQSYEVRLKSLYNDLRTCNKGVNANNGG